MEQRFVITIRRWLWLLVLSALLAGTTTYLIIKDQPVVYQAQTRLVIGPGIDTPDPDVNALRAGGQLMQTYAEISMTSPFLQSIINELELNATPLELRNFIQVTTNQETQILSFNVIHSDPERAIAIANLGAHNLVELSPSGPDSSSSILKEQMRVQARKIEAVIDQSEENIRKLESDLQAITQVENQSVVVLQTDNYLEKQRLIIEQLSQERARLSESLSALTVLYETLQKTTTNQVKIIEPAEIAIPIPSYLWIKIILGALAGFVLSGAFVFVFTYFDDTILTHEDLTQIDSIDTLGVISKHNRLEATDRDGLVITELPGCRAAENYRLIATKLLFANEQKTLGTLLVSNLSEELGRETGLVTANLALALAESGRRIALIDGNFRNPVITEIFDLVGKPGLTEVLADEQAVNLSSLIDWSPNLFILPHGTETATIIELLSSGRMIDLVETLKGEVDIILIDTSSLVTFSHTHLLATKVDSVIMIVQSGTTHMKELRELVESLQSIKANILGAIFDYYHSRSPLGLRGFLGRQVASRPRVFANRVRAVFQNPVSSQLVEIRTRATETNLLNTNQTESKDSGSLEHKNREKLEKEVFSIQVIKN